MEHYCQLGNHWWVYDQHGKVLSYYTNPINFDRQDCPDCIINKQSAEENKMQGTKITAEQISAVINQFRDGIEPADISSNTGISELRVRRELNLWLKNEGYNSIPDYRKRTIKKEKESIQQSSESIITDLKNQVRSLKQIVEEQKKMIESLNSQRVGEATANQMNTLKELVNRKSEELALANNVIREKNEAIKTASLAIKNMQERLSHQGKIENTEDTGTITIKLSADLVQLFRRL
jgi:hypothetical protein